MGVTTGCGNRNCRVKRRLSLACLAEHPVANTERANASNSVVSAPLLRFAQRSCVTTAVMLTFGYRQWVSFLITKEGVRDCRTLLIFVSVLFSAMLCCLKFVFVCFRSALNAFLAATAFAVLICRPFNRHSGKIDMVKEKLRKEEIRLRKP